MSALILSAFLISSSFAQKSVAPFIYGDALPDAPELAARGDYQVGVQTIKVVNKGQIDILNSKEGSDPLYDRGLTLEVWYPASLPAGMKAITFCHCIFRHTFEASRLRKILSTRIRFQ